MRRKFALGLTVAVIGGLAFVTLPPSAVHPAAAAASAMSIVTGAGPGGGPDVEVLDGDGHRTNGFYAYAPTFTGGVRVTTGDLNCDGTSEIITGAGPGGGPHVAVFNANGTPFIATGATAPTSFFAYQASLTSGISVAAGDLNGDGCDEIITAPGPGVEPKVNIFNDNGSFSNISFDAYDVGFSGGVWLATGDVDGDGKDEIITGAGPSGAPHVRVFKYDNASGQIVPMGGGWFAYDAGFRGGVRVAAADLDGSGKDQIITAPGSGGGPHVRSWTGVSGTPSTVNMFAYSAAFDGGVFVGGGGDKSRHTGGIQNTFVTGAGPGGGPNVVRFKGTNAQQVASFFPYNPAFHGGVSVALGDFNPQDSDHDGISDAREIQLGTNPNSADSDGDGLSDWVETSPNCPADHSLPACPHGGANIDTDHDGKVDALDTDSDNDGTPDGNGVEGTGDCDKNGVPNFRDANDKCSATSSTAKPPTSTTSTTG
ncbi:MAG TPA: hypothetical protein VFA83_03495 [Acidimicrobiales bacterium]|nr:hypothetical protein [Acidimicrobiales bacterium]